MLSKKLFENHFKELFTNNKLPITKNYLIFSKAAVNFCVSNFSLKATS